MNRFCRKRLLNAVQTKGTFILVQDIGAIRVWLTRLNQTRLEFVADIAMGQRDFY